MCLPLDWDKYEQTDTSTQADVNSIHPEKMSYGQESNLNQEKLSYFFTQEKDSSGKQSLSEGRVSTKEDEEEEELEDGVS